MRNILISLFLLSVSSALSANPTCDVPQNNFDGLYCLSKVYLEADKELNENYQALYAKLNDQGRKALKSSQSAWIDDRNHYCSKHESNEFFVNLNCATATTIKRSQILHDRIRECASSGCQNSKL